jgi:hypothetical protein
MRDGRTRGRTNRLICVLNAARGLGGFLASCSPGDEMRCAAA